MDNIINNLYTYDKNLFISKIYEQWITNLKKKASSKIKLLQYCYWCDSDSYFDYYSYGMCIDCCNYFEYNEFSTQIDDII